MKKSPDFSCGLWEQIAVPANGGKPKMEEHREEKRREEEEEEEKRVVTLVTREDQIIDESEDSDQFSYYE